MLITISPMSTPLVEERAVEIVERKGLGHPDSICDALTEELSLALSRFYFERFERVLHHNVDKALLFGGAAHSAFGGGEVVAPMEISLCGRATRAYRGVAVPIEELAEQRALRWLERHMPNIDAAKHVKIRPLVRPTADNLREVFERGAAQCQALANDTSCGVGFAPLTHLEKLVVAVEAALNDSQTKRSYPFIGEDVKVMGIRHGHRYSLTIACAFVDRYVSDLSDYVEKKLIAERLAADAARSIVGDVEITLNACDDVSASNVYTTVTGTSAEGGDDGEAGRGNRINGFMAPYRPMTLESAAGKNPVTHVGKLYNLAAGLIAEQIVESLPAVASAEVYLVSRIGHSIDDPLVADVRVALEPRFGTDGPRRSIEGIVRENLAAVGSLWQSLLSGEILLDRWPLRIKTSVTH